MKAAILGTTGYTGQVLLRLLAEHPEVSEIYPVSSSQAGQSLADMDPGLGDSLLEKTGKSGQALIKLEQAVEARPDVVFAALPHLKSAVVCEPFFGKSLVIDLSADFRISSPEVFMKAYKQAPPKPELLDQAVYGLCEWMEDRIRSADLIANPGCYPTAALLPLLPLVVAGLVEGDILINALSGVSGAGRKAQDNYLFCSRTENMNAYSPGTTHRHSQEIQQEVERWAGAFSGTEVANDSDKGSGTGKETDADGSGSKVYFTPHLVPVKQGEFITTSLKLKQATEDEAIERAYELAYKGRPWVRKVNKMPQSAQVRGTNRCDFFIHREEDRIFLFSVIDNLYKGASGQAVQNMNIRFGFDERAGLPAHGEI